MRRADRLFQLVQLMRGRRLTTAECLAARLEVSVRTVYRDIADLQHQGVPIEGEAGVGYRMRAGFDLPPLMFTRDEAQALVASVRLAQPRLDTVLARARRAALSPRSSACCRAAARAAAESLAVYAPPVGPDDATRERLRVLREAAEARRKRAARLRRPEGRAQRAARAATRLLLLGRGVDAGRLVRDAARLSQLPRRSHRARCRCSTNRFRDEPGKTLADLLRLVRA